MLKNQTPDLELLKPNANCIQHTLKCTTHPSYQYEYDYENRMTSIADSNSNTIAEFAYDALGRRIKKTDSVADETIYYYYSTNWQVLIEYDDANNFQRKFVYGNYIDEVLAMDNDDVLIDLFYSLHNHLYSPAALAIGNGTVVERYEYDAYGKPHVLEPDFSAAADNISDYANPYLFTGRRVDILDNSSLTIQYNRNRYYSYSLGRWYTHDPIGYELVMNLYEYCVSNAVYNIDPLGLFCGECVPSSSGAKARNPRITDWGTTPGASGDPDYAGDMSRAIKILDAIGGIRTLISMAGAGSWREAILKGVADGTFSISSSVLTAAALDAIDWINENLGKSHWRAGVYLWAYVEYDKCEKCTSLAGILARCATYEYKTYGDWHACPADTETEWQTDGAIPRRKFYSSEDRANAWRTAIEACQTSAKMRPDKPTSF